MGLSGRISLLGHDAEAVDLLEGENGLQDGLQLSHLLLPVEAHEVVRDGAIDASHAGRCVAQAQREAVDEIRPLRHAIRDPEDLPDGMVAEIIVFLAVREARRQLAALRRAEAPVMEEGLFAKRASRPAAHAGARDGDPVDSPCLVRDVPADLLEALAPKELTAAGDVILSFEAVGAGAVSVGFP